jgi:hypothetical protein
MQGGRSVERDEIVGSNAPREDQIGGSNFLFFIFLFFFFPLCIITNCWSWRNRRKQSEYGFGE